MNTMEIFINLSPFLAYTIWLLVSVFCGAVLTAIFMCVLGGKLNTKPQRSSNKDQDSPNSVPGWFTGWFLGMLERFFFTTAIAFGGVGPCMAALLIWITLKSQTHYNIFGGGGSPVLDRSQAYLAISGSLVSLSIAIICGHQIYLTCSGLSH